jgi:hypothetical protein
MSSAIFGPRRDEANESLGIFSGDDTKRGPRPPTYAKLEIVRQMLQETIAYSTLRIAVSLLELSRRGVLGSHQIVASFATWRSIQRRSICVDSRPRRLHNSNLRKIKNLVGQS